MPWIIAAVVILLLMARSTANATMTPPNGESGQEFRLRQLADAIGQIEGGSVSNPGNIRDSSGAIGQSGDLLTLLRRGFITGGSRYYSPDMTFTEFGWMYVSGTTPGDTSKVIKGDNPDNWAAFVAGKLGVSVDSTVGDFVNS
jgi:hypothetical protein